jgi:hypothetical protein
VTLDFSPHYTCGSLNKPAVISLNSINQLLYVMETCCVFPVVGAGFLNVIQMNFVLQRFELRSYYSLLHRNGNKFVGLVRFTTHVKYSSAQNCETV